MTANRRDFLHALGGAGATLALGAGGVRRAWAQERRGAGLTVAPLRDGLALVAGAGGNVVLASGGGDGVVAVDSGDAAHAASLQGLVSERFGGAPLAVLLNTHWHLEHTGGNETLAAAATQIVAHENTRLWMSTKIYDERANRYHLPRVPAALPNATFFTHEQQPLEIGTGAAKAVYGHLPEAHTDGDVYVFFPERNVLVAGGAATAGRYPYLDYQTGGWIGGLVDATRKLIEMADAQTLIVPDEGAPVRRADLEAQAEMLSSVRERIEAIALQGRGVEDMIAERITADFDERYAGDSAQFIEDVYEGLWWNRLRGIVA